MPPIPGPARRRPGNWDTWLNVMNVEIENGLSKRELYGAFYGEGPNWDNDGWRRIGAFSACVLTPLEWAGFVTLQETREPDGRLAHMIFRTPLWRSVLKLEIEPSTTQLPQMRFEPGCQDGAGFARVKEPGV